MSRVGVEAMGAWPSGGRSLSLAEDRQEVTVVMEDR